MRDKDRDEAFRKAKERAKEALNKAADQPSIHKKAMREALEGVAAMKSVSRAKATEAKRDAEKEVKRRGKARMPTPMGTQFRQVPSRNDRYKRHENKKESWNKGKILSVDPDRNQYRLRIVFDRER